MAQEQSPRRHRDYIRSEDEFIRTAVSTRHPGMARVRRALSQGDSDGAWNALFAHFARRRRPRDPLIDEWKTADLRTVRAAARSARENLADWRVDGKVDWDHGDRPARRDWEKYWSRGHVPHLWIWARAAEASGRPGLRRAAARLFLEWYNDRPAPRLPHREYWSREVHGFNWREIEVAIRGRRLIALFLAAVRWPESRPGFLRKLLVSVRQHLDYLRSYYEEFGFIEGNHQNHHAEAPLAAGVLLPELKGASRWRALGLRIYREHLRADFDADAVQNEYSPAYHQSMLAIYLNAYEVLKINRCRVPRWLERALRAMSKYLVYATDPAGWLVPVNDSRPVTSEAMRRRAARLLDMPELVRPAGGGRGRRAGRGLPASTAFLPAGLALMRSDWKPGATMVTLDATKHNSGHWHAGKPNLLVHAGAQPLACEHIFASYDDPSFVNYFHNARSHNTVLVDGEGDDVPASPWSYRYSSTPELDFFAPGVLADIARATTDGFRRMKPRVGFERTVVFVRPDLVLVHDVLDSRGEHLYEWLLHFPPGKLLAEARTGTLRTASGGEAELLCRPLGGCRDRVRGPRIRTGRTRNGTKGFPAAGRRYWSPPSPGEEPALLTGAPYAVWRRGGRRVVFDFLLQVLRRGDRPAEVEVLADARGSRTCGYAILGKRDRATVLFDDRPGRHRRALCAAGLTLRGRVGVAAAAGGRRELLADGRLSR